MLYVKIKAEFKNGPKGRFYRTFLVREDINLFNFCIGLCTMLGAKFEHCFLIDDRKKNTQYVMAPFLEDIFDDSRMKYIRNYTLCALSDNFSFEYDTGDGWDFSCKKYKKIITKENEGDFIFLEGAGMGIWEDNISSLYALFNGKIDPNLESEDQENGYYFPWNFKIEKFGDFDKPLSVEEINEKLNELYEADCDNIALQEVQYIEEYGIDVDFTEEEFF